MIATRAGLLLLAAGFTMGCASAPVDSAFDDVQHLVGDRTGAELSWDQDVSAKATVRDHVHEILARELRVEDAIQIALLSSPDLQAIYEELGVAQADLVQAGLPKNPFLEAEVRFPGPAAEGHVIQELVSLFTRPLEQRVAAERLEEAKLRVAAAVTNLAGQVAVAFFDFQGEQQIAEMRATVLAAADASRDAAQRLHKAGNITDLALANEDAMERQARLDLAEAEAMVIEKRERLNALMGLFGNDVTWHATARLQELPANEVPQPGLESLAIANNFEIAAARQEIASLAGSLGLVRATALLPELELGIHDSREVGGPNTLGPSIGLQLPIFDRGQGRVARGESLLRQSEQRLTARAIELRSRVRALYARMNAKRQRVDFYRKIVVPLRERIVEQTQLEYNGMLLGVFDLLRAKHDAIDAGREWIEALRDYWMARAELEALAGGKLPQEEPGAASAASNPEPATQPAKAPETPPEHDHHGGH